MNKIIKEKLKEVLLLIIIIVGFVSVLSVMLKYENEGEQNMPFSLSEMILISGVDEKQKSENPDSLKWNLDINQYNNIYLEFKKNEEYKKNTYIESVTIENIQYETDEENNINIYMPNSTEQSLFKYEDKFKVINSLTYKGANSDDTKALEINSEGGRILFRVVNQNIGEYVSNDDDEISYDGTLLKKIGVKEEKLKLNIKFDIVINTNIAKYRGKMNLDLPCGNIMNEGICKKIENNFTDVIFKRDK